MTVEVEFFYDYVSVYSYIANSQLATLGGAEISFRPMLLGAVMQATGNRPPGAVPAKGAYLTTDVERWVQRYALPFESNPLFPQNTLKALRLSLVARRHGKFDAVHEALFAAMWQEQRNLESLDVLRGIAATVSVPIDEIEDPAIKGELKSNTDEAVARGAFGAPTFFVGEQMFFGNDRLEFVKEALADRG
ncbi:MAG: 2-hydroxychromene-2-carboxylate isomerase [Woeseiaceae bacterium]|nr:2-hydroxychromene-2-carboxylate isomerase [Woeseiaceae bacterium]